MVYHLVLFAPRKDLPAEDERALANALEHAARAIPTVRDVRVGRRVKHGAGYETQPGVDFPYVAILAFDDLAGLRAYLAHPAHEALGARFGDSLEAALVGDYEMGGVDEMRGWLRM